MKDMIKVSKISRHYNVGKQIVKALDSITVNVKRNEYVSFMGPSGSGKSTLMNIIGCVLAKELRINYRNINVDLNCLIE